MDLITREESLRDAEQILRERDLLESLYEVIGKVAPKQAESRTSEREINEVFGEHGWPESRVHVANRNQPRFDGQRERVALEHEAGQQMNARSHLLFLEAAFRERKIDAGVMVIPNREYTNGAAVERVYEEATGEGKLFSYHFPLYIPLYLIEYDADAT